MATRYSVNEVLDFAGLSDCDSSGEEGEELYAYRRKATVQREALREAVSFSSDDQLASVPLCLIL